MNRSSQDSNLCYSITTTSYFFSENTKNLAQESSIKKDRFFEDGSELAICLHNITNSEHAIRLLSSIEYYLPDFKGEILITDTLSNPDQRKIFEEFIVTSTVAVKIIDLQGTDNIGHARNVTAANTTKKWLMFLDINMYLIKNPLPSIIRTIEDLGVQYVNLPTLNRDIKTINTLGGALFTDTHNNKRFLGGGSCFDFKTAIEFTDVTIDCPFLSDYLFGNACVVRRDAFLTEGGFNKDVPAGAEDIDFSLRLYNKSIKIGNINEFTVVSDHKATIDPEADSETLAGKAKTINTTDEKGKNDEIIYNRNIQKWIKYNSSKKRIALVVDIRDWAFHNIAKNIETYLSDKYDFTIFFQGDYPGEKWLDLYHVLYQQKFDMIMCFWRPVYKQIFGLAMRWYLTTKNISEEAYQQFLNDTILLTGVYDHLYLNPHDIKNNIDLFTNHIDGYFVSSHKLKDIYENIDGYIKPHMVIQDGVDLDKFYKTKGASFSSPAEPLVVGWAGNSKWGSDDGVDHKGFDTIIKPAVQELIEEGYKIKLLYADRQEPETHIPRAKMNDFYNSLDVYICASDIEGTPNPVLEAMAVGIGVISTDVGIVKEVFGKKQHEFLLEERSKECLKKKLIALITDRNILNTLAKENSIRISNWTWKSKCGRFEQFFDYYFYKKSIQNLHEKKFPYTTDQEIVSKTVVQVAASAVEVTSENQASNNTPALNGFDNNHVHVNNGQLFDEVQREADFWKQNATEIKVWYYKEYEVLPLWFKRLGHIIKVFQGRRSFRSLFSNNAANK